MGNALDAVEVGRLGQLLGADDDGPGDLELLDGLAGLEGVIPNGHTQQIQLVAKLGLEGLQLGNLGTTGRAPAGPEINNDDFTLTNVV